MISTRWPEAHHFTLACSMLLLLTLSASAQVKQKVKILNSGQQPGHYLDWDGTPILPIGDSATQGWMESGTNFNQNGYIDALSSRGINVAMIWSYVGTNAAGQAADTRIGYDAPEIWPWQGSIDTNTMDLTQLNQAYFDRMKSFVSYAESKDVLVLITVHDGGAKWRFDRHPFNTSKGNGPLTNAGQYVQLAHHDYTEMPTTFNPSWNHQQKNQYFQERFADKLITELEPYSNVIYEMFNEGEWYDRSDRRSHEEHFLRFFNNRTDALLMSNSDHIYGGYDPHLNSDVDIVSVHGAWTGQHSNFVNGFNETPAKSYFQSEPWPPEFNGTNMTMGTIRQSAWEQALAGAGWVAQNDTSFGWDPNAGMAAQSANRDAAYDNIGHVATFFNDLGVGFWDMAPDPTLASTGICLAELGDEYLVYAQTGGTFSVDLSAALDKPVDVQWYNPRTGVLTNATPVIGSAITPFTAPDSNDWVLLLSVTTVPESGDADGDGSVGADDLVVILTYWGQTGVTRQQGDVTGDGVVGADDYVEVLTYWGKGSPAPD